MSHFWTMTLWGQTLNMNTLIMVWAAMLVLLVFAFFSTRQLSIVPSYGQSVGEMLYDFCRSITLSTAGKRGDGFLYYVGSLFLLILTCNIMGQLPLRLITLPHGELMAATGDINMTAALALFTLLMYFVFGLKAKGFGYFKHYLSPLPALLKGQSPVAKVVFLFFFWPFTLLNFIEDLTRPGSLMMRLFFNVFVGEILAVVVTKLIPGGLGLGAFVIGLELFVAVLQAYIFAMLSSVYIAVMSEHHDEHAEEHA